MAQQFNGRQFVSALTQIDENIKRNSLGIDFEDSASYKGTPYNNPSYLLGNVYEAKELMATNVALRYNAIADEIEIKESLSTPNSEAKLLPKSPDIFVKIANDLFVFAPFQGGIEKGGYFQVMFEGKKYDLFKKLIKEFTPEKKASSSITTDMPARFKDAPVYFIVTKEGKFYELPESRKQKLKVFGSNKNLISDFVKENRLDLNIETDLIRVMQYYDGI
jgi:hypothetical protein